MQWLTVDVQQFHGQHGKAFLFETVANIDEGEPSDRNMTTGMHTVRDIYCAKCGEIVGWKYVRVASIAANPSTDTDKHGCTGQSI